MSRKKIPVIIDATKTTKKVCGFHCIKIKDIGVKLGDITILDSINLHIHCGKLTVIIGKNGAGKSTLLKAILGEIKHTGNIEFRDTRNNKYEDLKLGYVPQYLNIEKNTPMSVYDLFASFITNIPVFLIKQKAIYNKIFNQLKLFNGEHLIDKTVSELSGGELQRVLLSMATFPIPNLLILDEPVSGIDYNGMELFYKQIDILKNNYDLAIILVSHDFNFVSKYADHVILLDKTIIKEGSQAEVFNSKEFADVFGYKKG